MLGLGIQKFWNMRPKLPFRFKVQFYTEIEEIYNIDEILAISLTNINLPKMEGHAGEGSLYLGDTVYTIPVWSLGSRKLEITFEETDNMAITRFIDEIHNKSWRKNPYRITIIVHQFDEKMREDNLKPTRYSQSTGYVCHLSSFQEPVFKRDGNAGQLTVTATFIIDSVIENWDVNNEGEYLVAGNTDSNELNGYNDEIDFKDNSLKTRVDTSNLDGSYGGTTRDFNVSQKETDDVFAKIQQSPYKDKVSKEDLQAVQIENAKRMEKAYGEFERLMKENGYNVSINAYNDTSHELGIGTESGSHLLGQKIDLTMMDKNNNKLTPNNMKKEDLDKIVELAHQAGLTPNWETTGKTGSGWGDFALSEAKSIDKQGNVVDLTTRTWTGEKSVYNTGAKTYQGMGTV